MRIISFSIFLFLLIFSSMNANTSDDLIIRGADSLEYRVFRIYLVYELELESYDDSLKFVTLDQDYNFITKVQIIKNQNEYLYTYDEYEKLKIDTLNLIKNQKIKVQIGINLSIYREKIDIKLKFIDNKNRIYLKKLHIYQPLWLPKYNINYDLGYIYNCKEKHTNIKFKIENYSEEYDFQITDLSIENYDTSKYELYYLDKGFFANNSIKVNHLDTMNISSSNLQDFIIKCKSNDLILKDIEFSILYNGIFIQKKKIRIQNNDELYITWQDFEDDLIVDFTKTCLDSIKVNIPTAGNYSSFSFYTDDDHEIEIKEGIKTDGETYVTFYRNKPGTYMLCFSSCYFKEDLFFIVKNEE